MSHSSPSPKQSITGHWSPIEASGEIPKGRSSNISGVINNKFYIFAGENEPRIPVDGHIYELNINSKEWTKIPEREDRWPLARVGHSGIVHNNKLYLYGGRIGADMGDQTMGDFWCFDPNASAKENQWTPLPITGVPPTPLSYHSMAAGENEIYIFGGCTVSHGRTNDVWSFSLTKQEWAQETFTGEHSKKAHPTARGGASAVYASDGLHVLFGYNGKEELNDHWLWDHERRGWDLIPNTGDCPDARSVTEAVYLPKLGKKGSLFVFGGEFTPSDKGHEGAGSYHNDTWIFDIDSRKWTKMADDEKSPSARGWFTSSAMPDGKSVLVFGGFDGKERVNDAHVWSPDQ